jgi:hypothetical protein
MLLLLVVAVGIGGEQSAPGPASERGGAWNTMQAAKLLPAEARVTLGNRQWVFMFVQKFSLGEGRLPETYAELESSVYFPGPNALMNPYTKRPARAVDAPSYGDIKWTTDTWRDKNGSVLKSIAFSFYYDPDGKGKTVREDRGYFTDLEVRHFDEYRPVALKALEGLSPTEKRLYWTCGTLSGMVQFAQRNILGSVPERFEAYLALDWFFLPERMPNAWTGQTMREVTWENRAPGEFTYMPPVGDLGTRHWGLACYGDGGKVVYPAEWSVFEESEKTRKEAIEYVRTHGRVESAK